LQYHQILIKLIKFGKNLPSSSQDTYMHTDRLLATMILMLQT